MRPEGEPRDDRDDALEELEDDGALKAMRSVWLSMRDEEPGDGGLAALMAAAHAKAAELRPPSLWQRIAAALRRPPALAFATVLVLVGGAVVVSQHAKDEPERVAAPRSQVISPAREEAPQGNAMPAAPPAPVAPAPDDVRADGPGEASAAATTSSGGRTAPARPVERKPAPARKKSGKPASSEALGGAALDQAPAQIATDAKLDEDKSLARAPDDELAVLERKARTAADAGDCEAVEQLLAKLARRDPQARARAAAQPSIQRCVARMKAPAPADR